MASAKTDEYGRYFLPTKTVDGFYIPIFDLPDRDYKIYGQSPGYSPMLTYKSILGNSNIFWDFNLTNAITFKSINIYPQPFKHNSDLIFDFTNSEEDYQYGDIFSISIFSVSGTLIHKFFKNIGIGPFIYNWDGKTISGKEIGNGIYFCKLTLGDKVLLRKIIVTR